MNKDGIYAAYHKHVHYIKFQWAILVLAGILITGMVVNRIVNDPNSYTAGVSTHAASNTPTTGGDFSQLPELTRQLLEVARQLRKAAPEDRTAILEELRSVAQERRELMSQAIKENPRTALNNGLNASLRAQMPTDIRLLIEEKKTVKGKFEWIHEDYQDQNKSVEKFYITETGTNKRYQVEFSENGFPKAATDSVITVTGLALDEQLAADAGTVQVVVAASVATNTKKIASFLINFSTKTNSLSAATIRQSVYDFADNYYQENSFGKWGIVGKNSEDGSADVFGPYTIAFDGLTCDTATIQSQTKTAAAAAGVDLTGYTNLMYFFPSAGGCGFSGSATIGGSPAYVNMNGNAAQSVVTHELGHNMGSHHSGSWTCTENGVRVPVSADANCTLSEYGDPFDVMGNSSTRHMNSYHKSITSYSMNWLQASNTLTIDRNTAPDATYTIAPIEQASSGIQSIRIPRNVSGSTVLDYYFLEFRQPIGFDSGIASSTTSGVSIRIGYGFTTTSISKLIDTTPGTTSFSDAALAVGKTFTDPLKGINITTLSAASAGTEVRVSFGALPCSQIAPSIAISPTTKSGAPGSTQSYTVTVTNNDTTSCVGSSFDVTPTLATGFLQSPSSFVTPVLAPGASDTVTINVTAPDTATTGSYSFSEKAQNSLVAALSAAATASFNILVPDSTLPVVTITKPVDGAQVPLKGNLQLTASATDDRGVARIQLYIDSVLVKTCTNVTSCSGNYQANKISTGSHTVSANAYDAAGNVGTKSVTVIK